MQQIDLFHCNTTSGFQFPPPVVVQTTVTSAEASHEVMRFVDIKQKIYSLFLFNFVFLNLIASISAAGKPSFPVSPLPCFSSRLRQGDTSLQL